MAPHTAHCLMEAGKLMNVEVQWIAEPARVFVAVVEAAGDDVNLLRFHLGT